MVTHNVWSFWFDTFCRSYGTFLNLHLLHYRTSYIVGTAVQILFQVCRIVITICSWYYYTAISNRQIFDYIAVISACSRFNTFYDIVSLFHKCTSRWLSGNSVCFVRGMLWVWVPLVPLRCQTEDVKMGRDVSLIKRSAIRNERHESFGNDLKTEVPYDGEYWYVKETCCYDLQRYKLVSKFVVLHLE